MFGNKFPLSQPFGMILLLGLLAALMGCKTIDMGQSLSFFRSDPGFTDHLARGYRMLAEYEDYREADQAAALYFRDKAEKADRGEAVEPGIATDPDLSGSVRSELQTARKALTNALVGATEAKSGGATDPLKLAEAQVNFDCWLMRAVNQESAAQYCRDTFYQVIRNIEVAAADIPRTYSIFFNSGKAAPDSEGLNVIKQAAYAHALHEEWQVYLTGFSDPSGDRETNKILSARRALAVRNALAQYGVDPGKVIIDAFGEENAGKDLTPDEARRVDIRIEPAYAHRDAGSSHIEDLVPQFFD